MPCSIKAWSKPEQGFKTERGRGAILPAFFYFLKRISGGAKISRVALFFRKEIINANGEMLLEHI